MSKVMKQLKNEGTIRHYRRVKPYSTKIEYNGVTGSIGWWAEQLGISASTLYYRLRRNGWNIEQACSKPVRKAKHTNITYNGMTHSIREWARILGISESTLMSRFHKEWTVEQALTLPVDTSKQRYTNGRKPNRKKKDAKE